MSGQTDLFGAGPAPPKRPMATIPQPARPPMPEVYPPPPTLPWARLLTGAGAIETWIQVPVLWTKVVSEVLNLGADGRWILNADGTMRQIALDPGPRRRVVYRDAQDAWELHARRPLIPIAVGTHCITYRFAGPGEAAPAVLPLPAGDSTPPGTVNEGTDRP